MRRLYLHVPIYLPEIVYNPLRSFKRKLFPARQKTTNHLNLAGDRDIEWSWIYSELPAGPGEVLEFGPGGSSLGLVAAQRGFRVTAVDLNQAQYHYVHPNLNFVFGDLLELSLPQSHFDLAINCSTVEHVGLAGRYGVTKLRNDGDLEAMSLLRQLLKPSGSMLLTIPVGRDEVFAPICRVYGEKRLPLLLKEYSVKKEAYWAKDDSNRWVMSDQRTALSRKADAGSWDAMQNIYAIGCFVLQPLK